MRPYSVTVYYSGSKTYCVDAHNPEDAEEMANDYTKDEVRLLASHPNEAQKFIDSTRQHGGASMFLKSHKVIEPG